VGFDPLGRVIVTASDDGTARLWDANAGDQLALLDRRNGPVRALSADRNVLTVAGREARVLSPGGRRIERLRLPAAIAAAAAHGNSIAIADTSGDLELAALPEPPRMIPRLHVGALTYASDGTLITGSRDGTIRIWRSPTGPTRILQAPGPIAGIAAGGGRLLTR